MDRRFSALDEVIQSPGEVSINVKGAFIADDSPQVDDASSPRETSDIRLPYHKAVISHIALDVGWRSGLITCTGC